MDEFPPPVEPYRREPDPDPVARAAPQVFDDQPKPPRRLSPIAIAVIAVPSLLIVVGLVWGLKGGGVQPAPPDASVPEVVSVAPSSAPLPPVADLKIEDVVVGTGPEARAGDRVSVLYEGRLPDGTVFDATSRRGNEPFVFELGKGRVIKGWDQGVAGMRKGGKRKLTIPPDLAYGKRALGPIPANATLIFDIELVALNPG